MQKKTYYRFFNLVAERLKYLRIRTRDKLLFYIISSQRNTGEAAKKCLDSVYYQNFDKKYLKHVFIDDASDDDTHDIVQEWLSRHSNHCVEYIKNNVRVGGTANNLYGFKNAPDNSIVVELNGDDWLADNRVISFLNNVYSNSGIWMTYNTFKFSNGIVPESLIPIPGSVIQANSFREYSWVSSHLHSFRAKLFKYLHDDTFIDPDTGKYWESADDQAVYLSLLELCGVHSRHLYRVSYVYNLRDQSHQNWEADETFNRCNRIRKMPKYAPLLQL